MELFDFHAHVYPSAVAQKATQSICDFYDLTSSNLGTPEEKKQIDEQNGISRCLILGVAVEPRQVAGVNRYVAAVAANDPHFVAFGTVHADSTDTLETVSRFAEQGLKGVKIHPDMQKFSVDDPRLFALYDWMQGKLPLYIHSGDPRSTYSHPAGTARIMKMFPRLTVVAAHLGGWSMQETALPLLGPLENVIVDTSSAMSFMPPERAKKYIRAYGRERVFFGTDFPVGDPALEKRVLFSLPLTDDELEHIAYRNAERFFAGM
ncbi:MAG: amidohydrolase family protein [Clostridia bacterium]|nr:amidohydrolase family protein [Clostridia bacterium]